MQISSNDTLFGVPIMKLRAFFKRYTDNWDVESVIDFFDFEQEQAETLISELAREGYIEKGIVFHDELYWRNSIKGNALALASAAKPIRRTTADKKVKEFIERVYEVNENEYYLYKVKKVVLFGSYLSDAERLGDIDLAVEIFPKETDTDKFHKLTRARSKEAIRDGRR
jgi:predicted nucleotidyltransferase